MDENDRTEAAAGAPRNSVKSIVAQWAEARPDLDCRPMAVVGQIWRTGGLLTREVTRNLKDHDLDMPGFDVLLTLRRQGGLAPLTPSELAADMMMSPPAMTNRLDRLEQRGLIERIADPTDRRSIRIRLTADGLALIDRVVETHVATEERAIAALSQDERDLLVALLARIGE